MSACDQSSIFSTGGKFCPDYGLLLELHALTLVGRSYALLIQHITAFSRLCTKVPAQVSYESFWLRYFYKVQLLQEVCYSISVPQPERGVRINSIIFSTGGAAKGRVNGKGKAEGGTMEVGRRC